MLIDGQGNFGSVDGDPPAAFGESKRAAGAAFERDYFSNLARRCKGNVSEMARQSGMERHHVRAYLRKHKIDKAS